MLPEATPEEWRVIAQAPNYMVSDLGRVRSIKFRSSGVIRAQLNDGSGYLKVSLQVNGKTKTFFTHRLVAAAFCANPEDKPQVNHLNGAKNDNNAKNLEWVTSKENHEHADFVLSQLRLGRKPWVKANGKWVPPND